MLRFTSGGRTNDRRPGCSGNSFSTLLARCAGAVLLLAGGFALVRDAGADNPFEKITSPWQVVEIEKADKAPVRNSDLPPPVAVAEGSKRYLILTVRFKRVPKERVLESYRLLDTSTKKNVGTFAGHTGKDNNKDGKGGNEGKEGIIEFFFEGSWNELKGLALTGEGHRELLVKPDKTEIKPPDKDKKPEDPPKSGVDDEKQAESALKLAQYYLENKKPDRAKEKLEFILKKFPKTEAAKEAAKLMKEIK